MEQGSPVRILRCKSVQDSLYIPWQIGAMLLSGGAAAPERLAAAAGLPENMLDLWI